jgi:hypothetical protein
MIKDKIEIENCPILFREMRLRFILAIFAIIVSSDAWPEKAFAPYVDVASWPTLDVSVVAKATGVKYYTLAFIVADQKDRPAWAGIIPLTDNFYANQIQSLRALGGDVIISFGGATGKNFFEADYRPRTGIKD